MKTLQIDENKAKELFKNASNEFKAMLLDTFGESFFSEKITDRVKTYEDACKVVGIAPLKLSDFKFLPEKDRKPSYAFHQITTIAKALNEDWVPNWDNENEYKYYPWFRMGSSGVGFSADDYGDWFAYSSVGSRLCFKNRDLAVYAGKQFEEIYRDFMVIE